MLVNQIFMQKTQTRLGSISVVDRKKGSRRYRNIAGIVMKHCVCSRLKNLTT